MEMGYYMYCSWSNTKFYWTRNFKHARNNTWSAFFYLRPVLYRVMKSLSFFLSFFLIFSFEVNAELNSQQKRELKKQIENMKAVLPRRVDAMTTVIDAKMEGSTWILVTQVETGGMQMSEYGKSYIKNYARTSQHTRCYSFFIQLSLSLSLFLFSFHTLSFVRI